MCMCNMKNVDNRPLQGWRSLSNKLCAKIWKNVQKKMIEIVNYM